MLYVLSVKELVSILIWNVNGISYCIFIFNLSGHGKTHRDAASVQATHPIPASCGLYYFEVKIVSKGRDGYMGIGLSAQGVNMNRLPGKIDLNYYIVIQFAQSYFIELNIDNWKFVS